MASVLTIEELTGAARRLELVGPALPFRGAGWPSEQRLVTTRYQGNPEASQQVLGQAELPSEWAGMWHTPLLIATPSRFFDSNPYATEAQPIADAFTLYELFRSFQSAARLLRVTWSAGAGFGTRERSIVRRGRIAKFEPEFDRADDIKWRVSFDWIGAEQERRDVRPTSGESLLSTLAGLSKTMGDVASSLEAARALSARASLPLSADTFTLGDLEELAAAPSALLAEVGRACRQVESQATQAGAVIKRVRDTPATLRSQAATIARGAAAALSLLRQQTGIVPPETCSANNDRITPSLRGWNYLQLGSAGAQKAASKATDAKSALSPQNSGISTDARGKPSSPKDRAKTHVAKKGETFASIAKRFYGDASLAGDLAVANGFPAHQVAPPPGYPLVVPSLGD